MAAAVHDARRYEAATEAADAAGAAAVAKSHGMSPVDQVTVAWQKGWDKGII